MSNALLSKQTGIGKLITLKIIYEFIFIVL